MTFARDDHWVWDFWLADDGDLFHLFYLHAPRSLRDPDLRHRNARIGLATSADLRSWVDHGEVLGPGEPGSFDATATWTGSVVRGDDGLWRMFYTGSRFTSPTGIENVETVGVADSDDLATWTKRGEVLTASGPHYETLADGTWREEAWRDPWVYREGGQWHMLLTARSATGDPVDRGVIAHATSPDLGSWTLHAPRSDPGAGFMHLEVPQLVEIDGRDVLLFSCDSPHLAGARATAEESGGIYVLPVAAGAHRFPVEEAVRLVDERYYSGRAVRDRDGSWVLLAFENVGEDGDFVGRLSDPIPLRWAGDALIAGEDTSA